MEAGVINLRGVSYSAFQQIRFVFVQVTIKHCLDAGAGQVLQNIYSVVIALIQRRRDKTKIRKKENLLLNTCNFHRNFRFIFVIISENTQKCAFWTS